MRALRWLGLLLGLLVIVLVTLAVAARFADGPIALFPGGAFRSGEWADASGVDWSFAAPIEEVELQLVEPPRSRITWIMIHEEQPYVAAGFMNVPLWKQWPHEALEDGRAVLRVRGRRYPVRAVKVEDPEVYSEVAARAVEKYGLSEPPEPGSTWLFRLEPRSPE